MNGIEYKYIATALLTAGLMSVGQIMFSMAARNLNTDSLQAFLVSAISNGVLIAAVGLYAVTILIWTYTLKFLPLSVAYPITACAYIVTPLLAFAFLGEPLPAKLMVGSALILTGLTLVYV